MKQIPRCYHVLYLQHSIDVGASLEELGCDVFMATLSSCHQWGQRGHFAHPVHSRSLVQEELRGRGEGSGGGGGGGGGGEVINF